MQGKLQPFQNYFLRLNLISVFTKPSLWYASLFLLPQSNLKLAQNPNKSVFDLRKAKIYNYYTVGKAKKSSALFCFLLTILPNCFKLNV